MSTESETGVSMPRAVEVGPDPRPRSRLAIVLDRLQRERFWPRYLFFGLACQMAVLVLGWFFVVPAEGLGNDMGKGMVAHILFLVTLAWLVLGVLAWSILQTVRHRGQYSLRSKFAFVTVLCVLLSSAGVCVKHTWRRLEARQKLLAKIDGNGDVYREYPPWRIAADSFFFRTPQGNYWTPVPPIGLEILDVWFPPTFTIYCESPEFTDADFLALMREIPRVEEIILPAHIRGDVFLEQSPPLPDLKRLMLKTTRTRDFDPALLQKFPKLQSCVLTQSDVSFDCLRKLEQSYPRVGFTWDRLRVRTQRTYELCQTLYQQTKILVEVVSYADDWTAPPVEGESRLLLYVFLPSRVAAKEPEFEQLLSALREIQTEQPELKQFCIYGMDGPVQLTDAQLQQLVLVSPHWSKVLTGNSVTDAGFASLAAGKELVYVDARSATGITNAGLAPFRNHPTLEDLDLAGTKIDDGALEILRTIPNLRQGSVNGTGMTAAGEAEFAELLKQNVARHVDNLEATEQDQAQPVQTMASPPTAVAP